MKLFVTSAFLSTLAAAHFAQASVPPDPLPVLTYSLPGSDFPLPEPAGR